MKIIANIIILGLSTLLTEAQVTKKPSIREYLGDPIITDLLSTFFIPTQYNDNLLSSNKIAYWGDYYANIVVYNFQTDTYKNLFEKDTYIHSFRYDIYNRYEARGSSKLPNITASWVFLSVKPNDYNTNGKIDDKDPTILFVATTKGENLKQITDENENVVSFNIYEKQHFALIKIQRDVDKDKSFKYEDKDFYYKKIDLNDLSLGKGIEMR